MSVELLLTEFHRVSEAPDAVSQVRKFILALAARGKLVPQDPNDEPATKLLARIHSEKARLMEEGKIRNQAPQPEVDSASVPFPIPKGWIWVRLGDVIHLLSGQHLQPGEYSETNETGIPYITGPADFGQNGLVITRYAIVKKAVASRGHILLTVKGAGVGKTAVCNLPEVAISRQLMALTAVGWSQQFLLLTTHRLATALLEVARSLIPGISREDVDRFVFPLPPLAEQQRIVARVEELLHLCDDLKAAKAIREARRDKLVSASLARLITAADESSFKESARFYFNHLPRLTRRPEHIQQLRRTILNMAVRGRLVAQDDNDEPASELLKKLKVDRQKMGKSNTRMAAEPLEEISQNKIPYQLPRGWEWARLGALGDTNIGLTYSPRDISDHGIPVLRSNNIRNGKLVLSDVVRVDTNIKESALANEGDILICARNGSRALVGKAAMITRLQEKTAFGAFMAIFRSQLNRYIHVYLCSSLFRLMINEVNTTTINQITQGNLRSTLAPIPPLAEQYRIVEKVAQLLGLCDELEAAQAKPEALRLKLLNATLNQALISVESSSEIATGA